MSLKHTNPLRIAVVGAGTGGLAAAMLLAADGHEVTVYEKQPFIGGRNSRLELGEYRFDRGPTFFMMKHLVEELFALAGRKLEDYMRFAPLDPMYQLRFGDLHLDMTTDEARMEERIERLFAGNGGGYRRFMEQESRKFERISPLLQQPFSQLSHYLNLDLLKALPNLHLTDSVYTRLATYFREEKLRYAFAFQAKYLGMSPWACPGAFTILSYLEHRYGLYHPIGGVHRLSDAMADIAKEHGARILTGTGVSRILVERGRVSAVRLESGEAIPVDEVVIGADFAHAAKHLFEPGVLRKYSPERLERKRYSCSTFMLYLGVRRNIRLPHHTILFSGDYRSNVEDITKNGRLSQDPSVYVHNPSALDPSLAPPGKSSLYVLMPVPNADAPIDWERSKLQARQLVMRKLEREPELAGLEADIEAEQIVTPMDWQCDLHVHKGATFNLAHNLGQMMYFRPHNRFEEVDGCWLVGGGTHPGSGLPTILESAKITASLIRKQAGRPRSVFA